MRIAIFHDFFDQMGGAERLVLELAREFNATIITASLDPKIPREMGYPEVKITVLSRFPKSEPFKFHSSILAFANCDFSKEFDFFIFSGWFCAFAAKKHKPNLYYYHDLLRELYGLKRFAYEKHGFLTSTYYSLAAFAFKPLFESSLNNFDSIIANSEFSRAMISKYYKKDAPVIHPPIRTSEFFQKKSKGYWMSINRLYPTKAIELQLEAFSRIPGKRLLVCGDYSSSKIADRYVRELVQKAPSNVEFLFGVPFKKLKGIYSECEGVLATAPLEPFGMGVVEAMASGKPVVAINSGGFRETVSHKKTGFLVNPNADEIISAVEEISKNPEKFSGSCLQKSKKFDSKIFFSKIQKRLAT